MAKSRSTKAYRRLRDLLTQAREAAGMTQAEVAERIGRPQSFVSKVETGERRLDVVEFVEFAEAIGADPLRLLSDIRREVACA